MYHLAEVVEARKGDLVVKVAKQQEERGDQLMEAIVAHHGRVDSKPKMTRYPVNGDPDARFAEVLQSYLEQGYEVVAVHYPGHLEIAVSIDEKGVNLFRGLEQAIVAGVEELGNVGLLTGNWEVAYHAIGDKPEIELRQNGVEVRRVRMRSGFTCDPSSPDLWLWLLLGARGRVHAVTLVGAGELNVAAFARAMGRKHEERAARLGLIKNYIPWESVAQGAWF